MSPTGQGLDRNPPHGGMDGQAGTHRRPGRVRLQRFLAACAALALPALPLPGVAGDPTGTLVLADGFEHQGAISLSGGKLRVAGAGEAVTAALDEVVSLVMDAPDQAPVADDQSMMSGALPAPWRNKDLGRTRSPGTARWKNGQFVLQASPPAADEEFNAFHLVHRIVEGDAEVVARIAAIDAPQGNASGGIVMALGPDPKEHRALLSVSAGNSHLEFRRWGSAGGNSTAQGDASIRLPYWLKLVRTGKDVQAFHSPNGRHWKLFKESDGKFWRKELTIGLAARAYGDDDTLTVTIDHVRINGEGPPPAGPGLPRVVLASGSVLAGDIVRADASSIAFRGRWKPLQLTTPQVARIEFFHPLPDDCQPFLRGDRAGLLLRTGDFAEGSFDSLAEGRITIGSLLFGSSAFPVLDEVDALVFRPAAAPPATGYRVTTHAGSIFFTKRLSPTGRHLLLLADGLGELRLALDEVATITRLEKM